jgi:hypothetical protein
MKLITMDRPICTIASLAMVFDRSIDDIIRIIGHDGMIVTFPEESGNRKFRGIHPCEMQEVAMYFNRVFVETEYDPVTLAGPSGPSAHVYSITECRQRFKKLTRGRKGLLWGFTPTGRHIAAWDGSMAFDPRGWVSALLDNLVLPDLQIEGAFLIY